MSRVKSPKEKKRLSLKRDRRNRYGENSKSSRRNISKGKQRTHMKERRTVKETLRHLEGAVSENDASQAEFLAKTWTIQNHRKGFKKVPDTPLGEVLAKRQEKA
jgi:hypothetical protein